MILMLRRRRRLARAFGGLGPGLLVLLAGLASPATADERILAYHVEVDIREDASLDVTERITVRAEGGQIRRGIYRDFPTRYTDRYGNRVVPGFEMLGVERNGRPEPWFTERVSNGIRINTGSDELLPVPAEHRFTLRYRTTRQIGFFAGHDELYWNAIGTGWVFPIDRGSVEVRLPMAVPVEGMTAEAYTGPQGARGGAYVAELPAPGLARWRLTGPLAPREGLTVVLTFPKGLLPEPTRGQRARWFLSDNRGVLVALTGLLCLVGYCARDWWLVGRDPRRGVIIPRYNPPAGHPPAGLRYLRRMGYDMRCFSADVLALAVAGHLRIRRTRRFLRDEWRLERLEPDAPPSLLHSQRVLLGRLLPARLPWLELSQSNATTIVQARDAHRRALDGTLHQRYFRRHLDHVAIAAAIAAVAGLLALVIAAGNGVPAVVFVLCLMAATVFVFARLVRAPTSEGRRLLDEIEGLRLYLTVAEREELARMPGPDGPPLLDAGRYEALLPYAVALEVEEAWTRKFTAVAGAAAAAAASRSISWYQGGRVGDLGSLSRSLGRSLSSQIASSSRPPGSSSGSGGGGSSGGGGGGGGGGGR